MVFKRLWANLLKHTESKAECDDARIKIGEDELYKLRRELHHLHQLLNIDGYTPEVREQILEGFQSIRGYSDIIMRPCLGREQAYHIFLIGRGIQGGILQGSVIQEQIAYKTARNLAERCGDVYGAQQYSTWSLATHEDSTRPPHNSQCIIARISDPLDPIPDIRFGSLHPNGGGFVEFTANVDLEAQVEKGAHVLDFASVSHYAVVGGTSRVYGHAVIAPYAILEGNSCVGGSVNLPQGWYDGDNLCATRTRDQQDNLQSGFYSNP